MAKLGEARLIPSVEGIKEFRVPISRLMEAYPWSNPTIPELSDFLDDLHWFDKNKARLNYWINRVEAWADDTYIVRVKWKLVGRDRIRRGLQVHMGKIDEASFYRDGMLKHLKEGSIA